ncbi:hypothetical protein YC2023_081739 [Brassica napus]
MKHIQYPHPLSLSLKVSLPVWGMMSEMKALIAMVIVQIGYAGQDILFKLVIEDGVNVRVVVAYRLIFATIFMFLLAFIFERNKRPEFTWRLLILAFLVGLFGSAGPNILFAEALARTTATFISTATILVPLVTFVLAAILRTEHVHLGSKYGKAKVIGTLLGVGGLFFFVLYKGKEIHLWSSRIHLGGRTHSDTTPNISILAAFLALGGVISYSFWVLLQVKIGNGLGGPYWNTALMNMMGSLVALLVALIWKPDFEEWRLGWDIKLFARIFSGIVISGMAFAVIVWCVDANGPVFVSMFRPVRLVVVVIVASLILQEPIYSGSIIGTVILVGGLYLVLWAKKKEMKSMSNPVETNRTDRNVV